jgi:hypothetical protein
MSAPKADIWSYELLLRKMTFNPHCAEIRLSDVVPSMCNGHADAPTCNGIKVLEARLRSQDVFPTVG